VRGDVGDVAAKEVHGAGIGEVQPGDDAEQRGLAAAGRAEHREKLTARDGKADLVERGAGVKPSRHIDDFNGVCRSGTRHGASCSIRGPLGDKKPRPGKVFQALQITLQNNT